MFIMKLEEVWFCVFCFFFFLTKLFKFSSIIYEHFWEIIYSP